MVTTVEKFLGKYFNFKKAEKEQTKLKTMQKKEIITIRAESNKIVNRKIDDSNEIRVCLKR